MRLLRHPLLWVVLPLIGMFVIAGVLGNRSGTQGALSGTQAAEKADKAESKHGAANKPSVAAPALDAKIHAREYEPDCSKSENADLCAQRRMAKAAEEQTGLNIVGLGLLFFTLCATIAAALFARQAARAAQKTVVVMGATAKSQLRAYINTVEGTLINFDTACPVMQLVFKNFGNTPAHEVTVVQTAKLAELPLVTALTLNPVEGTRPFGVVGPGADFHLRLFLDHPPIPQELKDRIRAGLSAIYWFGTVNYKDAFGNDWWTTFRVMYKQEGSVVDTEGSLATCEEGNEAT